MPAPEEFVREERRIRLVSRATAVLVPLVLAGALVVRFRPQVVGSLPASGGGPVETGAISAGTPLPLRTVNVPGSALHVQPEEPQDTSSPATTPVRRRRPATVTDVILLPCSLPNPRADGAFIIPPHNPKHRTVVGLPSGSGEAKRGFVIPPHDPSEENRVPIEVISMDTLLEQSLRVPAHNPDSFNYVRRDTLPCRADSAPPT